MLANTGNLVKTGYTFAGWNTAADGSGASYAGGETFTMGASNAMLYAKWTQNPTYTVTYNGNGNTGGTVPTDANAYPQRSTVTVKGNTGNLARTDYTFAGWNTSADGKGTSYAGGVTFSMPAAYDTLYAVWTQNPTFSVIYNGNGNTGGGVPLDANAYLQGAAVTVLANTGSLIKTGYTFAGWNTRSNGNGTTYAAGSSLTIGAANDTLFAKWTLTMFTVTFNSNGGSAVASQIVNYDSLATLPTPAPAKTGYGFSGWYSDSLLTTAYNFSTPVTTSITLYAKWSIDLYTVKFNSNGGTAVDSQNVTYNSTATAPTPPTQNGFIFAGWYSDQALTIQFNFMTPITSSITLYAKWTPNTYAVIFDGQGATAAANPPTLNVTSPADSVGSLPQPPTKTSYVFAGWYTAVNGGGTQFTATTVVNANVTVYAKWIIQDADGNIYTEVTIGTQVWMVQNLKTTKYRDGGVIPLVTDSAAWSTVYNPAFCWYHDSTAYSATRYGAIYNWYAVSTGRLAPNGWHVPTNAEWTTLFNYLGGLTQGTSNQLSRLLK